MNVPRQAVSVPSRIDLKTELSGQDGDGRAAALNALKWGLSNARATLSGGIENGMSGIEYAKLYARFMDDLVSSLVDYVVNVLHRIENPTKSERLAVVAVGGFGRGRLAPGSDVDILFLLPYKQTPWGESVAETVLYVLWDLGLKVGHATRSVDESIRQAKADMTIRTALLESRLVWGDEALFNNLNARYRSEVAVAPGLDFIEAKLAERTARHKRMGESRYLVEPHVKDGKGGLRDLETLYWLARYLYQAKEPSDLVERGILTAEEVRIFQKADAFLWTVRVHLHLLTKRAEERLTFDVQPEMARRLGYQARGGLSAVERFMKHYFLVAKDVGDLTRIFCATLEDQQRKFRPGLRRFLPRLGGRLKMVGDFVNDNGRLDIARMDIFEKDPVNLLRLFEVADRHELDIHPHALAHVTRSLQLIDKTMRSDPEANAVFLSMLASRHDPERALRRLNESGVFGKFIPEFGRVVALMQFNMYHHFTVDEHLIRTIGFIAKIERGEMAESLPLSTEIVKNIASREVLYLSALLHDIAKGGARDHSEEGAEIAHKMGARLNLSAGDIDTTAWLVQNHLLMSDFAQKRDVSDPKTLSDFAQAVQSPERLRLLLLLTVADINAVGPAVWNGWKGQLLRLLYRDTESVLSGGLASDGRKARVKAAQDALLERIAEWPENEKKSALTRHYDAYWLSAVTNAHLRHAEMVRRAEAENRQIIMEAHPDRFRAITEVTLYAPDHPGLFARVAGAFAVAGASIIDAKIHTTVDGFALDTFWMQGVDGGAYEGEDKLARLKSVVTAALMGEIRPRDVLESRLKRSKREQSFAVPPRVIIDNNASLSHTVIEVNGRDRPGLLYDLTRAIFTLNLSIGSAHIATYGERAVDVFYVKDLMGQKLADPSRLRSVETKLLDALGEPKPPSTRKKAAA